MTRIQKHIPEGLLVSENLLLTVQHVNTVVRHSIKPFN